MEERPKRYYRFSKYLKEHFGCRVYKISIDAGFSCPNKDGRTSRDGCIYCDNKGFSFNTRSTGDRVSNEASILPPPIELQIEQGMEFGRKRFGAQKFIVYYQAYTNTYASLEVLKEKYDIVKKFKHIVGISIGTRPDCVNREVLDLIETYTSNYEVWLEYGLQSIHRKTLELINRNHAYGDFLRATELTRNRKNIKICAHIIIGLPYETRKDILETARTVGRLKLDGLKIHPLHIIKETKLEEFFKKGLYKPLQLDEYVSLAVEFLEYLWPETIIQRISAECPREFLVGPLWILEKNKVLSEIEKRLLEENRFQGKRWNSKVTSQF